MSDDSRQSMDDILASIRQAVAVGETSAPDEPVEPPQAPALPAPAPAEAVFEALVRSMLEPAIKAWLDANLPEIVERTTRAEIERMTRGD